MCNYAIGFMWDFCYNTAKISWVMYFSEEGCKSGLIGRSRKPCARKGTRVQIPPPPPLTSQGSFE